MVIGERMNLILNFIIFEYENILIFFFWKYVDILFFLLFFLIGRERIGFD